MNKFLLFLLICFIGLNPAVQAQYTYHGKIEYERKTNLHKLWEEDSWMDAWKDKMPTFILNYFNLVFTTSQSHYTPGREVEAPKITWGLPPGSDNNIFQDYSKGTVIAAKNIYEEHFLIQDQQQKHVWKISSEIRTIAGYKCRKAVTKICDSVYVVAFYTDDIPVSGGPEQMCGLPGMILEMAVPRLYTTWVATKVELTPVTPKELEPPTKGKAMNIAQLEAKIQLSLSDWGKSGKRNIWWSML